MKKRYRSGNFLESIHVKCTQQSQSDLISRIWEVFSAPGWSISPAIAMKQVDGPLVLWEMFALSISLDPVIRSDILDELASSIRWQANSYDHPPSAPTLFSPSIDWEQSIVEGHPTHPVGLSSAFSWK